MGSPHRQIASNHESAIKTQMTSESMVASLGQKSFREASANLPRACEKIVMEIRKIYAHFFFNLFVNCLNFFVNPLRNLFLLSVPKGPYGQKKKGSATLSLRKGPFRTNLQDITKLRIPATTKIASLPNNLPRNLPHTFSKPSAMHAICLKQKS